MPGEAATDEINFLQLPRLQQQLLAPRAGEEDIDCGINALVADLAIEHQLHVSRAFELLENQLVHAAAGFDQSGRHNRERARFFRVARRRENLARNFHRARVNAATHGAAAAAGRVVKRARGAGDGIEQNEDVLPGFDQALGALDRELRDPRVALDIGVAGARHDLGRGTIAAKIGDFLRPLIHQKNDELHLRVILGHGVGDVMQQRGFSRARRSDDEPALAHAERRHHIHDARRITLGNGFEFDPLVGIDRGQFFKRNQALILCRLFVVNFIQPHQLRPAIPAARLALNPHSVAQGEAPHDLGRDKNILRRLDEIAFRIAQETEALAGNLDDAFAKFQGLLAIRRSTLLGTIALPIPVKTLVRR